jgi:N-acetyl-beta-hexosaminidase
MKGMDLNQEYTDMETQEIRWYAPEVKMPCSNERIRFIDEAGSEFLGIYIASEDMFFIGMDEIGDFRYTDQVYVWTSIN